MCMCIDTSTGSLPNDKRKNIFSINIFQHNSVVSFNYVCGTLYNENFS